VTELPAPKPTDVVGAAANVVGALNDDWWLALQSIARLVHRDGIEPDEDVRLRRELTRLGFTARAVGEAFEWMDRAALSGSLMDSLAMLSPVSTAERVPHPIERAGMNQELWTAIDRCRRRGFVTDDLAERLLEGLRGTDTRDWDDAEVQDFLASILTTTNSTLAGHDLAALLAAPRGRFCN
jgi:uncharacterized protein Smg (DUF494 family)